jgi:hypothetical protein
LSAKTLVVLVTNTSSWPFGRLPERIEVLERKMFAVPVEVHLRSVVLSLGPSALPCCVCAPLPPNADHPFVTATLESERNMLNSVDRIWWSGFSFFLQDHVSDGSG